ncbi:MAG: V-type ATP synthase subunit I [Clostridiales bacterium]|nr:V-type ATP synthase subunit I [Clostridiales bacterium]
MSKLRAIVPQSATRPLLKELGELGCVEIDSSADRLAEEEWAEVLAKYAAPPQAEGFLGGLASARELLDRYAAVKSGFLSSRRQVTKREFQDEAIVKQACADADIINDLGRQVAACAGEEGRLTARKASLVAWQGLDVPLDVKSGKHYRILFGVSPAGGVPAQELVDEAASKEAADLTLVSSDREQNYYLLLVYAGLFDEVMDALKSKGFSVVGFKDVEGTAAANISLLDSRIQEIAGERQVIVDQIVAMADKKASIEMAIDALTIESHRDQVLSGLAGTKKTLYIEGWTPAEAIGGVTAILENYGCAYQFEEPTDEDEEEPPVLLHNHKLIQPFTMVTELYSLPTYKSGLDPNPFMAPFYFIFFGLMMADVAYGVIISLAAWFILKKMRPPEGGVMQRLMTLMVYCGVATSIWGLLFGGFFGNLVSAVSGGMLGHEVTIPAILFDPMKDPMNLFILSLVFGWIQLMTGLGLNAYKLIKHGRAFDALCDAGFWMILLLGIPVTALSVLGGSSITAGLVVFAVGALGIVIFGGREKKNPVSRLISGLGSLYGATSYLSDILSYARLLALGLASAVIAQVMNTMGTLGGGSVVGWFVFLLIFAIGHTFNVVINILGTYVHTSRLQYIEFFGKFFEPGGRPFAPLFNKTKYIEIIKEGN